MTNIVLAYPTLVGPLSETRLGRFEARIGRRLPEEYRQFLLDLNGGVPRHNGLRFFNEVDERPDETWFECYFSLNDANVPEKAKWRFHESLDRIWEGVRADAPSTTLVPIGRDPGGNLVCIETDGAEAGKIVFWDHDYNAVYALAPSLAEFHASLTRTDEEMEPPSVWVYRGQ